MTKASGLQSRALYALSVICRKIWPCWSSGSAVPYGCGGTRGAVTLVVVVVVVVDIERSRRGSVPGPATTATAIDRPSRRGGTACGRVRPFLVGGAWRCG